MDWWRAKLLLIVAFAFLDLFLAWQVSRLWVPKPVSQVPRPVAGGYTGPGSSSALPVLAVTTAGWQAPLLQLLPSPNCPDTAAQRAVASSFQCPGRAGYTLAWFNGVALFTQPGVNDTSPATARAIVEQLLRPLSADPPLPSVSSGPSALTVTGSPGTYTVQLLEAYDGFPLFNGHWRVSITPSQVQAQLKWLQVVEIASHLETVMPVARAEASTHTKAAPGGRPTLGYYSARTYSPGEVWYLAPVWRIPVDLTCGGTAKVPATVYLDAHSGTLVKPAGCPA